MPSLQIRDPHNRSLSQQALVDQQTLASGDPRLRRQQALERIAQRWGQRSPLQRPPLNWRQSPEELIRADRER
ncbi:MAG: hypothetical protein VKM34_01990 [Cyanobacteriota bacterium]|nr:hypothetical protein [Cyanobacteriota bacterium]